VTGTSGARAAVTGALITGTLLVAHAGPGITAIGPLRGRLFPRLAGRGDPRHVALTFDDGPDPCHTPPLLALLAGHRARATFFLLGERVAAAPGLVADITDAGHEVAVHGWDHRYTILTRPSVTCDGMARARDAIAAASGTVPRWYRPPYGVLSRSSLTAARRLALTPVLWSCWGREWVPGATPESVHRVLTAGLAPGGTVLLHDSDCTSPAGSAAAARGALPRLLADCAARGLTVGPLCEHGL